MGRYEQRINRVMQLLQSWGYKPTLNRTDDPEIEDDSIDITPEVHVQVDSRSGDAISVGRMVEKPKVVLYSWDIENDAQLIAALQEATAGVNPFGWGERRPS